MPRFFKVILKNTKEGNKTHYIYPDGWDSQKINVVAYKNTDGTFEWCIAEIEEQHKDMINQLLQDSNFKEISGKKAKDDIEIARPKIDVKVYLHRDVSPSIKQDLENFLNSKGLKYKLNG